MKSFRSSGCLLAVVLTMAPICFAQQQEEEEIPVIGTTCEELGYSGNGTDLIVPEGDDVGDGTLLGETSDNSSTGGAVLWCVGFDPKTGVGEPILSGSPDFSILSHNCSGTHWSEGYCCNVQVAFTPSQVGLHYAAILQREIVAWADTGEVFSNRIRCTNVAGLGVVQAEYSLVKKVFLPSGKEVNSDLHKMVPSIHYCKSRVTGVRPPPVLNKRRVRLQCMKTEKIQGQSRTIPVAGCRTRIHFEDGEHNGGHNRSGSGKDSHPDSPLRFGKLTGMDTGQIVSIPLEGLEFTYEAPDVSGDVKLVFEAADPEGELISPIHDTVFRVKIDKELAPLNDIPNFRVEIGSHEGDGFHTIGPVKDALKGVLEDFLKEARKKYGPDFTMTFETEGASLHWGGLFDYSSQRRWQTPHCGHRLGQEVDLSMSVFDRFSPSQKNDLKKIYYRYLKDRGFGFPVEAERPEYDQSGNEKANHWHVRKVR